MRGPARRPALGPAAARARRLTVEQVAEVLGRSVGSVKALQRRGLRRLRAELEPAGTPRTGETAGTTRAPLPARAAMTGAR
ncbi:sigma factor-like helix-turn-helix DNA-binding protein [Geodermatophilus poikilotrophus]|uniref:sigma factor-like helix-turn-helix DNA-binding protein n=1 Tax=Geodermatophilus poikilotrophus TaxID=1333667 RepID=UPI003CCBF76C